MVKSDVAFFPDFGNLFSPFLHIREKVGSFFLDFGNVFPRFSHIREICVPF